MGKLYLVPTPIGNLKDITLRAIETLKLVNIILAEDTRTSGKLMKHYDIHTHMEAFHKFNEHQKLEKVIDSLKQEEVSYALITDAGTPGISDPGFLLVRACLQNNVPIETLPGATALIPALVNSGLPSDRFVFEGFLPPKKGRKTRLSALVNEERTMIFYESPYKLLRLLNELENYLGDRQASVSRELTKKYEEKINGRLSTIQQLINNKSAIKGEFVIVVAGAKYEKTN